MTSRAYDPEIAPLVPLMPVETDWSDVPAARRRMLELLALLPAPPAAAAERVGVEDRVIPGPADPRGLSVRVYTPKGGAGPRPGVVYIHGGGFCFGTVDLEHAGALLAADAAGAVVVSVEYRLAPEHPFPAGLEDCYAALVWLASESRALGVDAERIGVMGQSAGGGLAAGLALLTRDRGGPALRVQLLGIPELDHRLETASMRAFVDTPLWSRPNAIMSWRCYLGDATGEVSPYASPAIAKDLRGLPPAYVSTMEFDPLRDEGIAYALRLLEAGVSVELHQFPGTFHGSAGIVPGAAVSRRAQAEWLDALTRGLRRQ
jgi:acetyl esterase/lipase